jgi:hypothetical protein
MQGGNQIQKGSACAHIHCTAAQQSLHLYIRRLYGVDSMMTSLECNISAAAAAVTARAAGQCHNHTATHSIDVAKQLPRSVLAATDTTDTLYWWTIHHAAICRQGNRHS